jgi:hypothetical protein
MNPPHYSHAWRQAHPAKWRALNHERRRVPKAELIRRNRERCKKYQFEHRFEIYCKYRDAYRTDNTKHLSRTTAMNALKAGKLKREPCEVCGAESEFHHEDYSKPLEVRHLCRRHHSAEHRRLRSVSA